MYEIQTLKEYFESKFGSDYSDLRFHEEFLKRGSAPFAMIKKWMEKSWASADVSQTTQLDKAA